MISLLSVAGCGALALLLWSMVGLAVAPRLLPRHAVAAAPALGYWFWR
jgi:hypothetical protein